MRNRLISLSNGNFRARDAFALNGSCLKTGWRKTLTAGASHKQLQRDDCDGLNSQLFLGPMRLYLNLSRRAFTNHRLFWIAFGVIFVGCLWSFLWIGSERARVSVKADELGKRIKEQAVAVEHRRQEQERLNREQQQTVLTEQQTLELTAAHQLIARKGFYWNKMISDLEEYVPKEAKIHSIRVEEVIDAAEGARATVEVKALGKTSAQLTEMMQKLGESKGMFTVGQTSQDATTDEGEVPFMLKLTYVPSGGGAR